MAKILADDFDKITVWEFEKAGLSKYEKYVELSPFPDSAITQIVYLTTTLCHLGGKRLWFHCPDCRRRVGVLFAGKYGYSCRHCLNLTYKSKNTNYRTKDYDLIKRCDNTVKANELLDQIKRYSYANQPTKKWKKIGQFLSNSIYTN